MANDIQKSISGNNIKNGTLVIQCKVTGATNNDFNNTNVSNLPSITDIQDKYDDRFDNPSYYYGGEYIDGGNV